MGDKHSRGPGPGEGRVRRSISPAAVLALYRRTGALREGHFRLTSGLHSPRYFQSALVLSHPRDAQRLGTALARRFDPRSVDIVLGPALGAILVAHVVARALDRTAIFAERVAGKLTLRRGFELPEGARALLVEDVLTTGGSLAELTVLVTLHGATVAGRGCLVDRRGPDVLSDVEVVALATVDAPTYPADTCPQCAQGVPVTAPGSRHSGGR